MKDLKLLKFEAGVQITISTNSIFKLRGALVAVTSDGLGLSEIYGYLSPSSNKICRDCYITRRDLHKI